ncbi:MAG: hypothetical protein UY31_C0031G0005 [Candidatus Wolfebacteria bacterium GW2011_GWE1_48_7]|uniref:Uncharacterized protein n=2 Tax=Candidatus Wolfeibacteriota TaxID=1752735 RepID=A0A0G1WGH3_9BACT|nr:MAG: hypothetical protein UX70_C0001G0624 [Candidatus Wolfebacteria bacterium GW2011_GWB1_47_1]KKU36537.1 MAG: hypothetical protein UX49_C0014G0018 [Candidatus Wolfebacteria bacterium GW2011_GWC2_46_275]KKU42448.1 MAG: hypothetical protein UX58_C0002G0162 [Candidatus Wolfebacteria bacterium GW2011_GWB2_46_69]KKU54233.1 MAG: hypothetical protein UX76_C0004G0037 [Candidatus Wolfebacteria bacterium GW2011_GWC1_47_103]KKU59601.1 MAG: hypothetical protein UX83_C0003G0016 [Candidatus Wolfebacteria
MLIVSLVVFSILSLVLAKVTAARAKEYSTSNEIEVRRTAMSLKLGVFILVVLSCCGIGLAFSLVF